METTTVKSTRYWSCRCANSWFQS